MGVPVSEMSDAYTKESATLSETIVKYGTLDPYDPQRVQIVNVSLQEFCNFFTVHISLMCGFLCFLLLFLLLKLPL